MELGLNFAKDGQGSKSLQTRTQVQVMAGHGRANMWHVSTFSRLPSFGLASSCVVTTRAMLTLFASLQQDSPGERRQRLQ